MDAMNEIKNRIKENYLVNPVTSVLEIIIQVGVDPERSETFKTCTRNALTPAVMSRVSSEISAGAEIMVNGVKHHVVVAYSPIFPHSTRFTTQDGHLDVIKVCVMREIARRLNAALAAEIAQGRTWPEEVKSVSVDFLISQPLEYVDIRIPETL
jgi:hypothetical protein